jgi:RecA/RadA recombinase
MMLAQMGVEEEDGREEEGPLDWGTFGSTSLDKQLAEGGLELRAALEEASPKSPQKKQGTAKARDMAI